MPIDFSQGDLDAFESAMTDDFRRRFIRFLNDRFPNSREEPPAELERAIQLQIDRAKSHGLAHERHVAVYALAAWLLGAEFLRDFPVAAKVFSSEKWRPHEKAEWLEEWLPAIFKALAGEA